MSVSLSDLFMAQMSQQAALHDNSTQAGRKKSAIEVADLFIRMHGYLPATCCIEVGAHKAEFSCAIKTKYPEKRVFAYEASPFVYEAFASGIYNDYPEIEYKNTAIADYDGETNFNVIHKIQDITVDSLEMRNSLYKNIDTQESSLITVPCTRLDTLFGANEYSDTVFSLWIDAEGAGMDVLNGATAILERTCSIYIEMESTTKFIGQALDAEIVEFLVKKGFIPLVRDFLFIHQYNAIFIKKQYHPNVVAGVQRFFSRCTAPGRGDLPAFT